MGKYKFFGIIFVLMVLFDQLTKIWVVYNIKYWPEPTRQDPDTGKLIYGCYDLPFRNLTWPNVIVAYKSFDYEVVFVMLCCRVRCARYRKLICPGFFKTFCF